MARRQRDGNGGAKARGGGLSARWTWALVLAVTAGFAVLVSRPYWPGGAAPDLRDPALAARGAPLYAAHCRQCHGEGAAGQDPAQRMGGTRPDGTYIAPALDGSAHAWHHPPEALFAVIKHGSRAAGSPMRGWAGRLSDAEIYAVIAYIQSLWPEPVRRRYDRMLAEGRDSAYR